MAHTHEEAHSTYYLDQLCTIAVCGALSLVAIVLYVQKALEFLAPFFQATLLIGSIALLVVVLIRAVALWYTVGQVPAHGAHHHHDHPAHDHHHGHGPECGHAHDHEHACPDDHDHVPAHGIRAEPPGHGHDHGLTTAAHAHHHHEHAPGHEHDHEHEHGWAPVRYAILLLPIILFFLRMPSEAFNIQCKDYKTLREVGRLPPLLLEVSRPFYVWAFGQEQADRFRPVDVETVQMAQKGTGVLSLSFKELAQAAYSPTSRDFYEGQMARVKGQFVPKTDKTFTLVRLKITCCSADAVALNVTIVSPDPVTDIPQLQWVEVTGQIQFRKGRGAEEYIAVLQIGKAEDIQRTSPDPNLYLY